MAKALFHKSQRVYVRPVGTYALIEKVVPHWVKGVEEPLRVTYDCGLGREFTASELVSEETLRGKDQSAHDDILVEHWRIQREKNRFETDDADHPYPGTFPVVVTDEQDWGGWRVPGAEYNRDPARIEHQARMIVNAPDLVRVAKALLQAAQRDPKAFPEDARPALKRASLILRHVYDVAEQPAVAAE